jgi:lambda family phage portal protein
LSNTVKTKPAPSPRPSLLDRAISYLSPERGARRMMYRMQQDVAEQFISGGYEGGSRGNRETRTWNPYPTDADSSSLFDLDELRSRSRDAVRNQPLATGVINTTVTNVVGAGLKLQSMIDANYLGMDEAAADEWQRHTERRFNLWATSKDCDIERTLNFNALLDLILRQRLENGEAFVLLPMVPLPGLPNPLRIQVVESDRVCNPNFAFDTPQCVAGVGKDAHGAPEKYWILRGHPGNLRYLDRSRWQWDPYSAFNARTGLRNVIHYYKPLRAGQTRGIPMLAPVIEPLKMISRLTQAELMASVVSSLFTVFVKTPTGQGLNNSPMGAPSSPVVNYGPGHQADAPKSDLALGSGLVVDLAAGEEIELADPKRPNGAFDPFFQAIVRQIGVATGIPFEVLIKHYTSSYTAARAAIEDAWQFFLTMRSDLVENVCQLIYPIWMAQEVAQGTIHAPGFFADPMIRAAYLGNQWNGPAKRQVDPMKEVEAAAIRVSEGFTTRTEETSSMTGGDWEAKNRQRGKEERLRREQGLADVATTIPSLTKEQVGTDKELPEAA